MIVFTFRIGLCYYNGKAKKHGESFADDEGCNSW